MRDEPLPVDPDELPPLHTPGNGPERRWDLALVVALGGAVGSLARFGLNELWPHPAGGFPWATFIENLSGCFLLGTLLVLLIDVWPTDGGVWRYARPFVAVGVLGGFTTFSTYAVDVRTLAVESSSVATLGYLVGTVVGGLVASWLGLTVGRAVAGVPQRSVLAREPS